jgi:hypothetical protein
MVYLEQDPRDILVGTSIWLQWESLGFAIGYERYSEVWEGEERTDTDLCFSLEHIFYLKLIIYAPEDNEVYSTILTESQRSLRPITEISELSNADFSDLLMENKGCLPANLPVGRWER